LCGTLVFTRITLGIALSFVSPSVFYFFIRFFSLLSRPCSFACNRSAAEATCRQCAAACGTRRHPTTLSRAPRTARCACGMPTSPNSRRPSSRGVPSVTSGRPTRGYYRRSEKASWAPNKRPPPSLSACPCGSRARFMHAHGCAARLRRRVPSAPMRASLRAPPPMGTSTSGPWQAPSRAPHASVPPHLRALSDSPPALLTHANAHAWHARMLEYCILQHGDANNAMNGDCSFCGAECSLLLHSRRRATMHPPFSPRPSLTHNVRRPSSSSPCALCAFVHREALREGGGDTLWAGSLRGLSTARRALVVHVSPLNSTPPTHPPPFLPADCHPLLPHCSRSPVLTSKGRKSLQLPSRTKCTSCHGLLSP